MLLSIESMRVGEFQLKHRVGSNEIEIRSVISFAMEIYLIIDIMSALMNFTERTIAVMEIRNQKHQMCVRWTRTAPCWSCFDGKAPINRFLSRFYVRNSHCSPSLWCDYAGIATPIQN